MIVKPPAHVRYGPQAVQVGRRRTSQTVTALSNALALHRQRGGAVPWQKPR